MRAWYLIYSKPQQEHVALENLDRQGYVSYLPRIRVRRRRQGRYVKVVEPMFPRYLFIQLNDQTDDWGPIRSTIGVSNLVRFGMQPARVPDGLVHTLKDREDEEGIQLIEPKELQHGDRVRIVEGVMAGYEAIFEARTSKERVSLLLKIANTTARVKVSRHDIEPADWR
ncbi:MAG: transcription/translation regulatory transformer protein RfaH [Gammaproteobacteria bacterium]|nr:transcription/translation regulatory transformer protein RfaH [Gammaproteobacteria bacterium]